jgi:hypothetical protein
VGVIEMVQGIDDPHVHKAGTWVTFGWTVTYVSGLQLTTRSVSITSTVAFPCTCTATITGPATITATIFDHGFCGRS